MRFLAVLTCIILFAVSPLAADCSAADKKALEDLDRSWGAASVRGDRAALEQIYASDYMSLSPGNTTNRTQVIDETVADAEKARTSSEPQPALTHDYYLINCTPSTATITHRNVATSTTDGKTEKVYSRSIHVMEKRNGKWQAVANAGHPLSDAATVMYLEHEWNDADRKGDAAWFDKHYASDLSSIASRTGKKIGKTEEMADLKARKDVTEWAELSDLSVRNEGDTAIVTGVNHVKGKDGEGKAFDRRIAFTDVWVKRDGRWQVLATQGTEVR